ncbi:hypothetical protein Salat_0988800 [Sesamum alatum]|uniref:Uncharacterized protein n=1 Tax=Sesamum alatum TaxID=300844 RepID=A0AAE1YLJ0_9LAMI|nr:hypothetical protein Salat_0988800 [Sesamum alatum]
METWQHPMPVQDPSVISSLFTQTEKQPLVKFLPIALPNTEISSQPTTASLLEVEKLYGVEGFGGVEKLWQFTSNNGMIEQPELIPMPKGYGTVKLAHLVWQPGFAVLEASARDFGKVVEEFEGG